MAITRRIGGPKRVVVAIQARLEDDVVIVADPAVNVEASDLDEYAASGFNLAHLNFLDGEKPTYFEIQSMTRRQKEASPDESHPRRIAAWRWRCAVTAHENYTIVDASGRETEPQQPDRAQNGDLGMMASAKWMDAMDPPAEYLHALSSMISTYSEASGPLASKSSTPSGDTGKSDGDSTEPG